MMEAIVSTLPDAAAVTEQLVAKYGAENLWQVQRMSDNFFRALLNDGTVSMAIIQSDGRITVREMDGVW